MSTIARRLKRAAGIATLALLALLPAAVQAAEEKTPLERRVEAAVLLNLARFVTWPESKFEGPASSIEICVIGSEEFSAITAGIVADKRVMDHPLRVVSNPQAAAALQGCHIVYFESGVSDADHDRLLRQLAGHAVLSVHEQASTRTDAVVRFYLEDRKVRFEINAAAAEREKLQVSAKLLAVARVVAR